NAERMRMYTEQSIFAPLDAFLHEIENDEDPKREARAEFRMHEFPNLNGSIAKHVLKHVKGMCGKSGVGSETDDLGSYQGRMPLSPFEKIQTNRSMKIPFLVVAIGQACTLRCRDCGNMSPYAPHEVSSYPIEEIIDDLKLILEYAEIIQGQKAVDSV
ncbi:hypothetical protein ACH6CV_06895, partial [Bacillota bacterium Meth-B3]